MYDVNTMSEDGGAIQSETLYLDIASNMTQQFTDNQLTKVKASPGI